MPNFTTPQDIRDRWIVSAEVPVTDDVLAKLIADAEDTIDSEIPGVITQIDAGEVPLTRYVKVVCRMVIRVLRNPEGIRSASATTGQVSENRMYGGDNPGELYLSDDDRRDLSGRRARRRAATVSTIPRGWGYR